MLIFPSILWRDSLNTLATKKQLFEEEKNPNASFYQNKCVWWTVLIFSGLGILSVILGPIIPLITGQD